MSHLIPETVLWEDWTVDPGSVYEGADGRFHLRGFENLELLTSDFKPLAAGHLAERRRWIVFRRHPNVEGVLCLCDPAKR